MRELDLSGFFHPPTQRRRYRRRVTLSVSVDVAEHLREVARRDGRYLADVLTDAFEQYSLEPEWSDRDGIRRRPSPGRSQIAVEFDPGVLDRLDRSARALGVSRSRLISLLVERIA